MGPQLEPRSGQAEIEGVGRIVFGMIPSTYRVFLVWKDLPVQSYEQGPTLAFALPASFTPCPGGSLGTCVV